MAQFFWYNVYVKLGDFNANVLTHSVNAVTGWQRPRIVLIGGAMEALF